MEKILKTDSGSIHYWTPDTIDENKKTLFLLHGLTADHRLFSHQVEYFRKNYNVITWDAPAHGASRPFEGFTYEKAARAVRDILDASGVKKAVLIGQSMGGYIAQSVIRRFPDRVSAFVSIDSTPYGLDYYTKSDRWWLRQIEWMSKLYPCKTLKKAIAKQCTVTDSARNNMQAMLQPYEKKELCHLMAIGYAGFLEDNCNLEITCPVLLILGCQDKTGKVQQYNEAWSARRGTPITWIEQAAHNSNDDQPEQVNRAIEEFLEAYSI